MSSQEPLRILAVDDEPVNLQVLIAILQAAGYRVGSAATGREALEAARRDRPDILLLDVMLPDLLGHEVSRQVKEDPALADVYVILVSETRVALDDRVQGLMGGADAYLPRPFTREELLAYVTSGARTRRLLARLKEETARRQRAEHEQELARQRESLQKDLHDGIGGIVTNLATLAELALRSESPAEMREAVETMGRLAREGVQEVRSVMGALELREVSWGDLVAEMRRFGTTMLEPHGLALRVSAPPAGRLGEGLDLYLYSNLLSLFKEAIANVVKHARASRVTLKVEVEPDAYAVVISDDGIGVPEAPRSGRGLPNMAARARHLGASLAVRRAAGTEITVRGPLPPVP